MPETDGVHLGLGINMAFPMLQLSGVRDVGPARFSVANASRRAALQMGRLLNALLAVLSAVLILPSPRAEGAKAAVRAARARLADSPHF